MVEATAAIRCAPIAVAIAPPGEELLLGGHVPAHHIDPIMRGLHTLEALDLCRRMAHHLQKLLVRPDVGRQRRDVEIADHDHAILAFSPHATKPSVHRLEKLELVAELLVQLRVGQVPASRHIDIMQDKWTSRAVGLGELDGEMTRMPSPANVAALEKCEGQAREDGDAVIALLAGNRDMGKAERAKLKLGKLALDAFDLL
jgi:hypothetical protein